jgi:hypothetical protein
MTYFISKKYRMPVKKYIQILMGLLLVAFFVERYCFCAIVFKDKNYGAVLIIAVLWFNSIFLNVIQKLRKTKQKKRLHELYQLDRAPDVGYCIIAFVGVLDMFKSFLLFWPANVMPLWLLISVL